MEWQEDTCQAAVTTAMYNCYHGKNITVLLVLHFSRWELSHLEAGFRILCQQRECAIFGMSATARVLLALALARVFVFRRYWWVVQQTHCRWVVAVGFEHTGVTF